MADESTRRSYRPNDAFSQGGETQVVGRRSADPLAELARLIGEPDPYNDIRRDAAHRSEPAQPAPQNDAVDWRQTVAAMPPFENLQAEPAIPHHASRQGDFDRDPYYPPSAMELPRSGMPGDGYDRPFVAGPQYPDQFRDDRNGDGYAAAAPHDAGRGPSDRYDVDHHDGRGRGEGHYASGRYDDGRLAGRHDPSRDDAIRLDADSRHATGASFYQEGSQVAARDSAMYDDPPRVRGRNGLITAVTLAACAVVGTAGAYGYRTYVGSGTSRVPPVITAETTPNKIPADSQTNKSIQDRVREQGQNERVVSREEQPMDIRGSSPPRQVLPSPYAPSPPTGSLPPAGGGNQGRGTQQPQSGNSAASGGFTEPKAIRTIPIRPDGTDVSGRPVTGTTPLAPARPATAPKSPQAPRGPVSLDPQAQNSSQNSAPNSATVPSSRDREFNTAPPVDPPRLASAPTNAVPPPASSQTGAFMVQLSSQKSEAEAQASFRSIQARYPDQLGGHSPIVRRADLGSKGVFYRTMVGPFGSQDEATRFCSNLKAAGGTCIIQRN